MAKKFGKTTFTQMLGQIQQETKAARLDDACAQEFHYLQLFVDYVPREVRFVDILFQRLAQSKNGEKYNQVVADPRHNRIEKDPDTDVTTKCTRAYILRGCDKEFMQETIKAAVQKLPLELAVQDF